MKHNGLPLRHEEKYYITYAEYQVLRSRLLPLMHPDEFSREADYRVRSLYYDDIYESAYYQKEAGVFQRAKYRIRAYNDKTDNIKLEKKLKFGAYISKKSANLNLKQYDLLLAGKPEFLLSGSTFMQEFYSNIRTRLLSPRVIVDYWREALVREEGNVRVTFDKHLEAGISGFDIFDEGVMYVSAMEPHYLVMEVKFDDFLPAAIGRALQSVSTRQAISKYVLCRQKKELTQRKEVL